ncbi:hypothetical protein WL48_16910 [Burkholderia ubonensis]|nr:hypothetical protein WL48_16910 [Burkholderia ubonensis]
MIDIIFAMKIDFDGDLFLQQCVSADEDITIGTRIIKRCNLEFRKLLERTLGFTRQIRSIARHRSAQTFVS